MPSPLEVQPAVASSQAEAAKSRFLAAQLNSRYADCAAAMLLVASFLFVAFGDFGPQILVVVAGAIAISLVAKARRENLERKMWWHQARAGLVAALAQTGAGRPAPVVDLDESTSVIDIRDSAVESN